MKWDNDNKVPVEGTYIPSGISAETMLNLLRADFLWSEEDWKKHEKEHLSVFSVEKLSPNDFMLQHRYMDYDACVPMMEELLHQSACFKPKEVADHLHDIVDSVTLMSEIFDGMSRCDHANLLCRLYFCEKEEDFWDIFPDGVGNPMDWARSYAGERVSGHTTKTVSDERFKRFIKYMELKGISLKTRFNELYV